MAFGETTEEAFHYLYHTHQACEIQVHTHTQSKGNVHICGLINKYENKL